MDSTTYPEPGSRKSSAFPQKIVDLGNLPEPPPTGTLDIHLRSA